MRFAASQGRWTLPLAIVVSAACGTDTASDELETTPLIAGNGAAVQAAETAATAQAALRAAFITSVQAGAGEEYRVRPDLAGRLRAANPGQGFEVEADADGVRIQGRGAAEFEISTALARLGCEGDAAGVTSRPTASSMIAAASPSGT